MKSSTEAAYFSAEDWQIPGLKLSDKTKYQHCLKLTVPELKTSEDGQSFISNLEAFIQGYTIQFPGQHVILVFDINHTKIGSPRVSGRKLLDVVGHKIMDAGHRIIVIDSVENNPIKFGVIKLAQLTLYRFNIIFVTSEKEAIQKVLELNPRSKA